MPHKILLLTLLFTLVFWLICSAVGYFSSGTGMPWEWLYADTTLPRFIMRIISASFIVLLGIVAASVAVVREKKFEAARVSSGGWRSIVDEVNDAVLIHDVNTDAILDVNAKACEMFGRSVSELCQLTIEKISLGEPPYAQEYAKRWIRKTVSDGPQRFEWMAKHKDGRSFWVEIRLKHKVLEDKECVLAVVRDISEHKETEKALAESETRYGSVFENSPVAIGLIDTAGRIVEMNERLAEWLGYELDEMVGRSLDRLPALAGDAKRKVMKAMDRRMKGERVPPYEVELTAKDGHSIRCEVNVAVIRNEDDQVIGEIVMIVNTSERAKAQLALAESEKKYRTIFETSPEAIVVLDPGGKVADVNGRVFDILGYTPEEVRGQHILRVPTMPLESRIKGMKMLLQRMRGKDIPAYDLTFITKGGERRLGRIRAKELRDDEGNVVGDLVMITDITESEQAEQAMRESEERYRDLFENANDLIQSVDEENKFVYVNNKWLERLEYTRSEVESLTLDNILIEDQRRHCSELIDRLRSGESLSNVETVFVSKSGKEIVVEGNIGAHFENGRFKSTRGIFRDITERKQMERDLRGALQFKSEILTNVSHELKAPLIGVIGFLEIILMDEENPLPDRVRLYISRAANSAKNLQKLISDLLEVSRIDAGELMVCLEKFALDEVVHDCVNSVAGMLIGKDVVMDMELGEGGIDITSDRSKVMGIVINLLSNAAKFTEKGEIVVSTSFSKERLGFVDIVIRDTGKGIPENELKNIFKKFKQVDVGYRGSGLGLYIVKQYVDLLGGAIEVESKLGKGTVFRVALPALSSFQDEPTPRV